MLASTRINCRPRNSSFRIISRPQHVWWIRFCVSSHESNKPNASMYVRSVRHVSNNKCKYSIICVNWIKHMLSIYNVNMLDCYHGACCCLVGVGWCMLCYRGRLMSPEGTLSSCHRLVLFVFLLCCHVAFFVFSRSLLHWYGFPQRRCCCFVLACDRPRGHPRSPKCSSCLMM